MANTMQRAPGSAPVGRAPLSAPQTHGQTAASKLASSGGSNTAYMAARGATPVNTLGTSKPTPAPAPATPPTLQPRDPANYTPPKLETQTPSTNFMQIPGSQLKPLETAQALTPDQQTNALSALGTADQQQKALALNSMPNIKNDPQGYVDFQKQMDLQRQTQLQQQPPGLSQSTPVQAQNNHAMAISQMLATPGLPPEVMEALQRAQSHFSEGAQQPVGGGLTMRPAAAEAAPSVPSSVVKPPAQPKTVPTAPAAAAKPDFKGRTTSMQRRGTGVGKPAGPPKAKTSTSAAQDFISTMG
jgi:hypothetical protein